MVRERSKTEQPLFSLFSLDFRDGLSPALLDTVSSVATQQSSAGNCAVKSEPSDTNINILHGHLPQPHTLYI